MFIMYLITGIFLVAFIYLFMIVYYLYQDIDKLNENAINQYSVNHYVDQRLKYYRLIVNDRMGWKRSALKDYATSKELDILIADLGYERLGEPARPEQMSFVKKSRIN
jgi:ABC-type uncharacterized transport system fused permease/ATPase subunit